MANSLHSLEVTVTTVDPERSPAEPDSRLELEPDLAPGMEPEDGGPKRRYIKKQSAEQQGSNIPLGWKPTVQAPVPVVRCHHIFKDDHPRGGERCGRWSLRGSRLCYRHSGNGNLKNVEEYRQAIIDAARLQLIESAPAAVDVMLDLMANSPADNVRLKAAESVLDRTGLKIAEEINVNVEVTEMNPAVVLAERMQKLKTAAETIRRKDEEAAEQRALEAAAVVEPDGEIIEGEIVDGE